MKSIKEQQADDLNFRHTNTHDNCMNCKYRDKGYFNQMESVCKLFNFTIDEEHVCDLF
jgi:hypothetical protein